MIGLIAIAVVFVGGAVWALMHDDLWGRNQDEFSDSEDLGLQMQS